MYCNIRVGLREEYSRALNAYLLDVDELASAVSPGAFGGKMLACEESNNRCDTARSAWELHSLEHLCNRDRPNAIAFGASRKAAFTESLAASDRRFALSGYSHANSGWGLCLDVFPLFGLVRRYLSA